MGTIRDLRLLAVLLLTLSLFTTQTFGQRLAPGVAPQHYQQVPVQQQQQYQQHPQHQQQQQQQQYHQQQQQMPVAPGVAPQHYQPQQQVQYQQVPVQQQQQQHPQQPQVPQQQQQQHHQPQQQHHQQPQPQHQQPHGHHGAPHGQQQVLHGGNMDQERAHIQEHMQVPIDTSKMSEAELQFHYFKMHDSDNNNKLDGCELIKSLIHWHAEDKQDTNKTNTEGGTGEKDGAVYTDQGLADVIDYVLKTMDFNKDGYVDYMEYRQSEEGQKKGGKQ